MTWSKKKLKGKIKKYREANENDNITYQNFWDAAKVVIKGKFISLQAYLKKQEKSQVNNLTLHLKN